MELIQVRIFSHAPISSFLVSP